MADPYGNYLANLNPFAGPGLAPVGLTREQATLYGMPKPPEAMDPGLSYLGGGIAGEMGLSSLQNMADLGHGIDPRYNSAGLDVGPKAAQALGSLGAGAMRGMIFAPPSAAGVLGGRLMKGWDPKMEATSDKMAAAGLPDQAIYDATKLFKTADNQWKREIPDANASIKPQALETLQNLYDNPNKTGFVVGKLSDFVEHPMLFREYPEAANIQTKMRFLPGDQYSGGYDYNSPRTFAGTNISSQAGLTIPERAPTSLLGVTLHEINHAIANSEGFAAGSSPRGEMSRLRDLAERLMKQHNDELQSPSPNQAKIERLRTALSNLRDNFDPFQTYLRVAGEVDSRAVQERMNYGAPQLNAISPRTTVNDLVPLWNQIVRPF